MHQRALHIALLWISFHTLSAQITITNAVFPTVGDTLHYAIGNQPGAINQIFTPPGGPQQWDLSDLQPSQTWDQIMRDPATGSASSSFPGASLYFHPVNSTAESYVQVTTNQVLDAGYAGFDPLGLGLDLAFKNVPRLEVSWSPVNFFDIKQSTSNVLTAFAASSAPPLLLNLVPTADSFRIRITYQSVSTIDAFGTLAIPGGDFDVLRKKQTLYRSIAVDVKVAPLGWIDISTIGGQQILPFGTDTLTIFHFLNDFSKEAIAICTLNTNQNQVTGVQYKLVNPPTSTRAPEQYGVLSVYPNPVRDILSVHLETDAVVPLQLRLIDAAGNIVLDQPVDVQNGILDLVIPVAHLAPGPYELILEHHGVPVARSRVIKS